MARYDCDRPDQVRDNVTGDVLPLIPMEEEVLTALEQDCFVVVIALGLAWPLALSTER